MARSLEFFGGKRTGDLMTRIGSDTDNLCTFLSLHALDFANDLLMIVLTACILISIDPMLALVTLFPFPVIAVVVNSGAVSCAAGSINRAGRGRA